MSNEIKPWKQLSDRSLYKTRVFDLCVQRMQAPHGTYEDDFYYIKTFDWVNIIPITPDNKVVLVKQFRHGIRELTLELPGGMLSPEESNPLEAAVRELEEETGYVPREVIELGITHPNPALINNRLHYFLAKDVHLERPQNLDPAEDISVHLVPLSEIPAMISKQEITHCNMISAFFFLFNLSR